MGDSTIHPTALVDPAARIGDGVSIGPFCVIGAAEIGAGVVIHSHVVLADGVIVGEETEVFPGAVIGKEPKGAGATARLPTFDRHDKRGALVHFHGMETLVLNGIHDVLTPPEHSEEIVRLVPGAEHVVIEEAGHIIMLEHPEVLNEQFESLVERGMRAADEGVAVTRKPRVRRTVTDLAKRRQVARARKARRHG